MLNRFRIFRRVQQIFSLSAGLLQSGCQPENGFAAVMFILSGFPVACFARALLEGAFLSQEKCTSGWCTPEKFLPARERKKRTSFEFAVGLFRDFFCTDWIVSMHELEFNFGNSAAGEAGVQFHCDIAGSHQF